MSPLSPEAREAILAILESEDVRALINPEVTSLLTESPNPLFHTQDLWAGLKNFGTFAVDSDRIFIRPGLIDFEAFAGMIGRIGSFYAAYGPADDPALGVLLEGAPRLDLGVDGEVAHALEDALDGRREGDREEGGRALVDAEHDRGGVDPAPHAGASYPAAVAAAAGRARGGSPAAPSMPPQTSS